jgi:hypothetical protein
MGRQLAAKRERLKEFQRAGRRPKVKSVWEQHVVAALTQLRDLLQGDVGAAAHLPGSYWEITAARFFSDMIRAWPTLRTLSISS